MKAIRITDSVASGKYSTHESGDSSYDHTAGKVKFSVLGVAVCLTLGFSAVELLAGLAGNSLALVGDAGHMATDAMSLLFVLVANFFSRKGADSDHSFGHGRLEALAAFLNAVVMSLVIIWIVFEAVHRILEPEAVSGGSVALVAALGLVVNVAVAASLARDRDNMNTRAALVHVMGDLLGSLSAIAAGLVVWLGGPAIVDPMLSLVVAALLVKATAGIFSESSKVLLDAVPDGIEFARLGDAIAKVRGVTGVHDLHVWTMAPGHGAVQVHIGVASLAEWGRILSDVRRVIREDFGIDHISVQPEIE